MRAFHALLVCLVVAVSCLTGCPSPEPDHPRTVERVKSGPTIDIAGKNLPPEEELGALLNGQAEYGVLQNGVRMAVVPFKVVGDAKRGWMGEAVSELVSSKLSRVDGVWVLEREHLGAIVEQLRADDTDGAVSQATSKAKLLKAEYLVVGKILPGDGQWTAVATPVRVRDGVRLASVSFPVAENDFSAVDETATKVLAEVGIEGPSIDRGTPLSPASIEKATRGRALLMKGELLEALPLFEEALAKPSDAWGFEADYLRLMTQLGMTDWVEARSRDLLKRMPKGAANTCPRAKVLIELSDATDDVTDAREAVRVAASCGDAAVLADALIAYALVFGDIDHARSIAALERARALLAGSPNPHLVCLADFRLYFAVEQRALDVQSGEHERYAALSKQCEAAGNISYAALSMSNSGLNAWSHAERLSHLEKAHALAKRVGGRRLSLITIDLAAELQRAGQIEKADALLLGAMRERLESILALHGGKLPDPELRLPKDLLASMGMKPAPATNDAIEGLDALRLKAHRAALSWLLHAWANRTARATNAEAAASQAETYRNLARSLVGEQAPPKEIGARFSQRLEREGGITLEALEQATTPPLLNTGFKAMPALAALSGWFYAINRNAEPELADRLLAAFQKVARWSNAPSWQMYAKRAEAVLLGERDRGPEALAALKAAETLVVKEPAVSDDLAERRVVILRKTDAKAALEASRARVPLAKATSVDRWLNAVYNWGYYAIDVSDADTAAAVKELATITTQLLEAKSWERAARGLELTGLLDVAARRASGTQTAVALFSRRVEVLDRLGDPQRSLEARAELLRQVSLEHHQTFGGGAALRMKENHHAIALMQSIAEQAGRLAQRANHREAVRVVSKLPSAAPNLAALAKRAVDWAEHFRGSDEYAPLVAVLYGQLADNARDRAEKRQHWKRAQELYAAAGNVEQAIEQLRRVVRETPSENDALALTDECLTLAAGNDWLEAGCVYGMAENLRDNLRRRPTNRAKLADLARRGAAARAVVDRRGNTEHRYEFRTFVAGLAAAGRDFEVAEALHRDVRDLLAQRNSYEYAQHLSRLAPAFHEPKPARAVELYEEFFRTPGPSTHYKVQMYPKAAFAARLAGDRDKEKELLDQGLELLQRAPSSIVSYALYGPSRAFEDGRWKDLAAEYDEGIALLKKYYPSYGQMIRELEVGRAVAHQWAGNDRKAETAINVLVAAIEEGKNRFKAPCNDAMILEIAAGIAFAQGRCPRGTELQQEAAKRRAGCSRSCVRAPNGNEWCDTGGDYRAPNACNAAFPKDDTAISLKLLGPT